MAYTYRTEQFGIHGAIGSIFRDGVFVWSTDTIQAFGPYDTDRKRAARIVRERIAKLKQLDGIVVLGTRQIRTDATWSA